MEFDPRITEYIANANEFAVPILQHLRALVHRAEPGIEEKMKWGHVHFDYKGPVCMMAAFKEHCTFGFWKSKLLPDPENLISDEAKSSVGQFGKITSLADLPKDEIIMLYIRNAVELNEKGIKIAKPKVTTPKAELVIPEDFADMLANNAAAQQKFNAFSYSHKKEYLQWITEAKTEATRKKRMDSALEMITEGKSRYEKYRS